MSKLKAVLERVSTTCRVLREGVEGVLRLLSRAEVAVFSGLGLVSLTLPSLAATRELAIDR